MNRSAYHGPASTQQAMQHPSFQILPSVYPGIEAMQADSALTFGRHTHLQFGLGVIDRGAQKSASGRGVVEAGPGDTITVNPGEVHDGIPLSENGRAWRMLYLAPPLVDALAADVLCGSPESAFEFHAPSIRDVRLRALVRALHGATTTGPSPTSGLQVEECLLFVIRLLLRPTTRPQPAPSITSALAMMNDDPTAPWSLAQLAQETGLSRFQLVRQFSRATGLTPHAYLIQRRLHHARQLIRAGSPLATVAAASGFADQSHLTRIFVRSFGISPGAYLRAQR